VTELESAWEALLAEPRQGDGWIVRRISRQASVPVLAGVRQPDGRIALLVEVDAESIAPTVDYPSARGFEIFPETVRPGPHGTVRLCLLHAESRGAELFRLLAHDIGGAVSRTDHRLNVARAVLDRLRVWQGFFRRDTEGLTLEEQEGLFGELLFLETLIDAGLGSDSAISAWQGPAGAPRDFCLAACQIEIKAGTSPDGFFVSSVDQLDSDSPGPLLVAFIELEETPGGTSLPEIVSRIGDGLRNTSQRAADAFEDRLLQSGYLAAQGGSYSLRRWRLVRRFFFRVAGDFPRIRRTELRSGVVDVRYRVALSQCLPFRVPEGEAIELACRMP
jgi:hypothetical protein